MPTISEAQCVVLDVTFEGYGKVVEQSPKARTPMTKNMKVHLKLKP